MQQLCLLCEFYLRSCILADVSIKRMKINAELRDVQGRREGGRESQLPQACNQIMLKRSRNSHVGKENAIASRCSWP